MSAPVARTRDVPGYSAHRLTPLYFSHSSADFRSSPLDFLQSISDPRDGPHLLQFENLRPAIAVHDHRFHHWLGRFGPERANGGKNRDQNSITDSQLLAKATN